MVKADATVLHVKHSDASKLTSELPKKMYLINNTLLITNTLLRIITFNVITIHSYPNLVASFDSESFYFMLYLCLCVVMSLGGLGVVIN